MMYQVFENKYDREVFTTDDKELAEKFKERAEKYVEYFMKNKPTQSLIHEEIYDIVCRKLYGKSGREHLDEFSFIDYSEESSEQYEERLKQEDIENKLIYETTKSLPIEKRSIYTSLHYVAYDTKYYIKEVVFEKELPELFIQRTPEEYLDVVGDEAEFLKKDFERLCNENLSNL